jgi:hypothetical protein
VANILQRQGLEPAPTERLDGVFQGALKASGRRRLHDGRGMDRRGPVTFYLLFVIALAKRRVGCADLTTTPEEP